MALPPCRRPGVGRHPAADGPDVGRQSLSILGAALEDGRMHQRPPGVADLRTYKHGDGIGSIERVLQYLRPVLPCTKILLVEECRDAALGKEAMDVANLVTITAVVAEEQGGRR
jgi:hypothetical protein